MGNYGQGGGHLPVAPLATPVVTAAVLPHTGASTMVQVAGVAASVLVAWGVAYYMSQR